MSFRLIDANAIAEKYPEVNDMPCIYTDLENGLDNKFHFSSTGISEEDKDCYVLDWASNELKMALNALGEGKNDEEVNKTAKKCYESAIRCYQALVADQHTGNSIGITKEIFNRLVNVMPLTPIGKDEDCWQELEGKPGNYICTRYTSLTKKTDKDGAITYHDSRRVVCKDILTGNKYNSGFVANLIDIVLPIVLPYNPSIKKIVVYTKDVTIGDNWYLGIIDAFNIDNQPTQIHKYVKINEKAAESVVEISEEEFNKIYNEHVNSVKPLSD